jgi:hypothetical protein
MPAMRRKERNGPGIDTELPAVSCGWGTAGDWTVVVVSEEESEAML